MRPVTLLAVLGVLVGAAHGSTTRRPLIPGLPVFSGLSLSNIPGISHIMNMPLPFNVPFSLSSLPPLRFPPIRLPAILGGSGGGGMLRNATHLIRNTFLTPLGSSGGSGGGGAGGGGSSSSSSAVLSSLNANSLTSMLASPFMPLLNLGGGGLQAANRDGVIDPAQYAAQYLRALQFQQSAHERRRRSIVHHMLRNYQPAPLQPVPLQVPLEAQFRMLYRYH